MPTDKREELLKQILDNDSWIIEGVYIMHGFWSVLNRQIKFMS